MTLSRSADRPWALALLISVAALTALLFAWLWSAYAFYAGVAGAALLFGGFTLLPSRHLIAHSISLGFCIGVCVGSAIGILGLSNSG